MTPPLIQPHLSSHEVLSVGRESRWLRKAGTADCLSRERRQEIWAPHPALVNFPLSELFLCIPINKHILKTHDVSSYGLGTRDPPKRN